MNALLLAWIANEDLKALDDPNPEELGPTLRATRDLSPERLVLLSNYPGSTQAKITKRYQSWVSDQTGCAVDLVSTKVPDPSDHVAIHGAATRCVEGIQLKYPKAELHFLLSAGTPAMHAVWLLLGKARFHAKLVKCSIESGTEIVQLPFEISTDFAPGLLERSDEELLRLTQGLTPEAPEFDDIVQGCAEMQQAVAIARHLAPRSLTVLILGESGTGKELFARAIHESSPRKGNEFLALNCGAIPTELIDSRLFGHKKGAFTGAFEDTPGVFEKADGGTLFLDEIGELPLDAQVRLLRVLEEGEVVRIGEHKPRSIDVRVLAATHVDLFEAVALGRFRKDLLYRIAVGIVRLTPLRDRGKDMHVLIDRLTMEIQDELRNQPDFMKRPLTESARSRLARHDWPGNVRELRTTLIRAALFAAGSKIDRGDIEDALLPSMADASPGILGRPLGGGLDLRDLQAELRRHYVERALKESGGVKAHAARLLNVTPQTFQHWSSAQKSST